MKSKIFLLFLLSILLSSCFNREEAIDEPMDTNQIVGTWKIEDRFYPLTTDCEREEYIVFYADSTLYRDQCGNTRGKWYVVNGELRVDLDLNVDSLGYSDADFKCFFVEKNIIKAQSLSNKMLWVKYKKVE